MREKVRDRERLQHILRAKDLIAQSEQLFSMAFAKQNPIVYFGFVKQVEIIGEAVYKLTLEFKNRHSEVKWRVIENMRHVLVHGYYQIQPDKLWDTIQNDIPPLRPLIEKCLEDPELE